MIVIKRATPSGMDGLDCGPEVRCADCDKGMHGMIWVAERLLGMYHSEPVVELLCLGCARKAKFLLSMTAKPKDEE